MSLEHEMKKIQQERFVEQANEEQKSASKRNEEEKQGERQLSLLYQQVALISRDVNILLDEALQILKKENLWKNIKKHEIGLGATLHENGFTMGDVDESGIGSYSTTRYVNFRKPKRDGTAVRLSYSDLPSDSYTTHVFPTHYEWEIVSFEKITKSYFFFFAKDVGVTVKKLIHVKCEIETGQHISINELKRNIAQQVMDSIDAQKKRQEYIKKLPFSERPPRIYLPKPLEVVLVFVWRTFSYHYKGFSDPSKEFDWAEEW